MSNIITKVKFRVKNKMQPAEGEFGWTRVLADLNTEISKPQEMASIVERKIERGEPWPEAQF